MRVVAADAVCVKVEVVRSLVVIHGSVVQVGKAKPVDAKGQEVGGRVLGDYEYVVEGESFFAYMVVIWKPFFSCDCQSWVVHNS